MAALKVHTFAGRVIGDQHQHIAVLHEPFDDLAPLFPRYTAVDYVDRIGVADPGSNLVEEVVQRVLRFRKNDQLPPIAVGIDHQIIVQNAVELGPLSVEAGPQDAKRHRLKALERVHLQGELLHRFCGRRAGRDQLLKIIDFILAVLVDVPEDVCADVRRGNADPAACARQTRFAQLVFQPLTAPLQGLVDRCRRGSEAALQDLQREADIVALFAISFREPLHAVHLRANIFGDSGVERCLQLGELILDGVGAALGEKRPPIEAKQLFLGETTHHIRRVGVMHAVAEATLEAIAVKERHEKLEVLFLAVVRRGGHQQEVTAGFTELLSHLVALRVFDVAAEVSRRHAVRLIADDQVPFPRAC